MRRRRLSWCRVGFGWRALWIVAALAAPLVGFARLEAQATTTCAGRELSLRRESVLPVPNGTLISRAEAIDSDAVLFWSPDTAQIGIARFSDSVQVFLLPQGTQVAGAGSDPGIVIVFDRSTSSFIRLSDETGALKGTILVPGLLRWKVRQIRRLGTRWVGIGTDRKGQSELFAIAGRAPALTYQSLAKLPLPDSLLELAVDPDGRVLIANRIEPFEIWRYVTQAPTGPAFFDLVPELSAEAGRNAILVGMGPVAVECGYIRVIADLGSDRRWLIRYSLEGRLVGLARLGAPIGFVAADVGTKTAFAAIRTSRLVLARYTYE